MTNSRNIEDLLPQVSMKAQTLQREAVRLLGIDELRITSTYRDFEEQRRLYGIGRGTDAGKHPTITNAGPGHSWHNWRRAFDVCPIRKGVAVWGDDALWAKIGKLGKSLGLEWGGDFKSFPDRPHFQLAEGLTLAQLLKDHPKGLA